MHSLVLPAVDIIIACHRFPSEDANGRARQGETKEGKQGKGRAKMGFGWRYGVPYGDLFKYVGVYIRGDFSGSGSLFSFFS